MQINSILRDIEKEALNLCPKSIGPIGMDYRKRTKIERLLFLSTKEYCSSFLNYDLGGLTSTHRKLLVKYAKRNVLESYHVEMIIKAFDISQFVRDLASCDSYAQSDAMEQLGGAVFTVFENLSNRIVKFTIAMRNNIQVIKKQNDNLIS